jgi:chemotaxis protein CheX
MSDLPVAEWQQAATEVAFEIGSSVLAFGQCSPPERLAAIGDGRRGAYVPILSGDYSLHVGIVSDGAGCANLTRALLGMGPDEDVSLDDVRDAVGEIANMVAGGVKTRITARGIPVQIGLPIFIHGHIEGGAATQSMVSQMKFDDVDICVTIIKTAKHSGRGSVRA